jgi:hypothetical protein
MVLESLLKSNAQHLPGYESIKTYDTIAATAWYIWWLRRTRTHNERIPPLMQCVKSIKAIMDNGARGKSQSSQHKNNMVQTPGELG